jgi:Zn-dependent metalloprotease
MTAAARPTRGGGAIDRAASRLARAIAPALAAIGRRAAPLALSTALAAAATAPVAAQTTARDPAAVRAAVWARIGELLPAGGLPGGVAPRVAWNPDGTLHYLGMPAGASLPPSHQEPEHPETAALAFLTDNAVMFGTGDPAFGFQVQRIRDRVVRRFVRVEETAHGVPVFGGEMIVQLDPQDGIEAITGNVSRGVFPRTATEASPAVDAASASAAALARAMAAGASPLLEVGQPSLEWFVPELLHEEGPVTLVWSIEVRDPLSPTFHHRWLLDGGDASLVREFPLLCSAISRQIFDMASDTLNSPPPLVRNEGGAATGVADADDAYDMLGDTYDFYWTRHGRDGVNGAGATHQAVVRACTKGADPRCPWGNASGGKQSMWFGLGMVEDDVLAHEWTHGVTGYESALIYANESGSINESLSDIWGEFVDLVNGRGNDAANVRWDIGEDLAGPVLMGRLRDMDNPPALSDPDRLGSSLYYVGTDEDFEVHTNSGVNNKLCFLLTDGDTFNGQTVYGVGIDRVADLYYEAQTDLLFSSSGWAALAVALQQAAVNLGWSDADQLNLYRGLLAVEIASAQDLWVDAAASCFLWAGLPTCQGLAGPFPSVSFGHSAAHPGDVLHVRAGSYPGPHTLTKPLTLRAEGGVVTIGP